MNITSADLYTDFSGFNSLRAEARSGSDTGRRAAAEQIEAMFLGMMLKSMRAAGGSMLSGAGGKVREDMFDSQLALSLAKNSRLGFTDLMLREFNVPKSQDPTQGAEAAPGLPVGSVRVDKFASGLWGRAVSAAEASHGVQAPSSGANTRAIPSVASAPGVVAHDGEPPARWNTSDEFVSSLWPAAQRAAKSLGTKPEAVMAVAALETGWGKHMPASTNGERSNNLFGIKAHGWAGSMVHSPTLEFESGSFVRKLEPFRSYASAQQSFDDFVSFIKSRPRYAGVLDSGGDPVAFVRALHKAGYATDPEYAGKLEALINSDTMRKAQGVAGVATGSVSPTG